MALPQFSKFPSEKLDYSIDMTQWLGSDRLTNATATTTGNLAVTSTFTGSMCVVWLSSGDVGTQYLIKCHFITEKGREKDFFFQVFISDPTKPDLDLRTGNRSPFQ